MAETKRPTRNTRLYTAVIGDMVDSRTISGHARMRVQLRFSRFIAELNRNPRYRRALRSRFAITLGDEFHCVLQDPLVLPDLLWDVDNAADLPHFRIGIGYGKIDTEIPTYAVNVDGPALHHAREAIDLAKKEDLLGGVFAGFGEQNDLVANGVARLLQFQLEKSTSIQRNILGLLRQGRSQVEIAALTGRSPQAVSDHKSAAGWDAFHAGELALCGILKLATRQTPK